MMFVSYNNTNTMISNIRCVYCWEATSASGTDRSFFCFISVIAADSLVPSVLAFHPHMVRLLEWWRFGAGRHFFP